MQLIFLIALMCALIFLIAHLTRY